MNEKNSPNWRYLRRLPMSEENEAELSETYNSLPEVTLRERLDEFQDKKRGIVTKFPELATGSYGPGHEQTFELQNCNDHIRLIEKAMQSRARPSSYSVKRDRDEIGAIGSNATHGIGKGAMIADYAFWQKLEVEFWALPDSTDRLVAMWSGLGLRVSYDGSGDGMHRRRVRSLFDALAERGGIAAGAPNGADALDHWLNLLRQESPLFQRVSNVNSDGSETDAGGWIQGLRTASAEYCKVCATRAFGQEMAAGAGAGANNLTKPDARERVAKAALQERPPSRREIERLANEKFEAGRKGRMEAHAEKEAEALAAARSKGNRGVFLPTLIECRQERLREEILALADAWVEAGSLYKVPLDEWAERALEKAAELMAAGAASALRGELDLHAGRTRTPRSTAGNREIGSTLNSALREAKLKLKLQRIEARTAETHPASTEAEATLTTKEPTGRAVSKKRLTLKAIMQRIESWRMGAGSDGGKLTQKQVANLIGFDVRAYSAARAGKPRGKDHYGKVSKFAKDKGLL